MQIKGKYFKTRKDGVKLYQFKSDNGMMIKNELTGTLYSEAIEIMNSENTYVETDIPIESEE